VTDVRPGPGLAGYAELLELAVDVADEAAGLVRARRLGGVEVADTKSSPTDIVTEVDTAAERLIFERLMAARPGDGFLGEEGGSSGSTSSGSTSSGSTSSGSTGAVEWVVDPIDGTVNFLYGIPAYAVSIAAAVGGESVVGVVVDVAGGERFTATRDGGAFLDGVRLRLPSGPPRPLSQRLVGTGFNYVRDVRVRQAVAVSALLHEVRDVRRIGSAALDLCFVAAGRYDAFVEEGLNRWDLAAGGLVATEAGAVLSQRAGVGGTPCYLCAPETGFEEFLDLVERCGFLAPEGGE
jgi:myo-inositol-1(or 4)-monophosphatase